MSSYAERAALVSQHKRQAERENARSAGDNDFSACGPPNWDRQQWEAFKGIYGFYPFGLDGKGGMVMPPTFENAPSWVFGLMGIREPPIRTIRA
jgi:hypothetical protein